MRTTSTSAPASIEQAKALVDQPLRTAVDALDSRLRRIAAYQMGWVAADGSPTPAAGGKAVRPALVLLSARAAGADAVVGIPGAVAVELVHNFSLLHDDVMDRDLERRHRPTGWTVFGDGPAILAGNAMLICAIETLMAAGDRGPAAVSTLLGATQRLITGQGQDLAYEQRTDVSLADVLEMEAGKTAALLAGAVGIGAVLAGAAPELITALTEFGEQLGTAFQLRDDVLGIDGDPALTGKSASNDLRVGKRSAPVVAALTSGTAAGHELAALLLGGPPATDADVDRAADLVRLAGGVRYAETEAAVALDRSLGALAGAGLEPDVHRDLEELARFVVGRDH